eukprot:TRINITY_DN18030_c1_g7_i1.p2 TRINITY_DN18030_c1_g7~~TRINITY_DN18030_c1_g7_i1.p2  ORF type:complete len:147 (+),score=32.41 TRINITY_DN18030_c1_g7_i1:47-442(+)
MAESRTIIQYIIVREDLARDLHWAAGAVVAQCCHASTAAIWENADDDLTKEYLHPDNINRMHKVVLKCKNLSELLKLQTKVKENGIPHKLWLELPEETPTALATKPIIKEEFCGVFKKMQLYRDNIVKAVG